MSDEQVVATIEVVLRRELGEPMNEEHYADIAYMIVNESGLEAENERLREALRVPEGFVVVPKEPTIEMEEAMEQTYHAWTAPMEHPFAGIYRAAITTALRVDDNSAR